MNIGFSPRNKNYFSKDKVFCVRCRQQIEKIAIHTYCWNRKASTEETYCIKCFEKIRSAYVVLEKKTVILVEMLPDDCIPVVNRPPILANCKDMSLFEAADRQLGNESVKDNTVYSGRPDGSWSGLKIGNPDMKLLKAKDKPLKTKEGLKLLMGSR